ncbi:hypothetical protein BV898_12723 [Hypsibius exemplaris]|uniref:Uncharacterized protein n=1 Tax=Hypsibius exemplaris TaxID=2072580 RepID=A0A1W0WCX1_HYPEX|nr:hypothetical protein BV898_12723 [Hypsibius exemplaris]
MKHESVSVHHHETQSNITAKRKCIECSKFYIEDCKVKREATRRKDVELCQGKIARSQEIERNYSELLMTKDRQVQGVEKVELALSLRQAISKRKAEQHALNNASSLQHQALTSELYICQQEHSVIVEELRKETRLYEESERDLFEKRKDKQARLTERKLRQIQKRQEHPILLENLKGATEAGKTKSVALESAVSILKRKAESLEADLGMVKAKLDAVKGVKEQVECAEGKLKETEQKVVSKQEKHHADLREKAEAMKSRCDLCADGAAADQKVLQEQAVVIAKLETMKAAIENKNSKVTSNADAMARQLDNLRRIQLPLAQDSREANERKSVDILKWKRKFQVAKKNPHRYFEELKKQVKRLQNELKAKTMS